MTNDPFGDINGMMNISADNAADRRKNVSMYDLGFTDVESFVGIKRLTARPKGRASCSQSEKDEQIVNTASEMGIISANLAITSTVFPLHMRFEDINDINAANSTR